MVHNRANPMSNASLKTEEPIGIATKPTHSTMVAEVLSRGLSVKLQVLQFHYMVVALFSREYGQRE
jgi:hypothetical protein